MTGKIIKGIAGFYYVLVESAVYECKAKGIFRKEKKKPMVGDDVEIEVLDPETMTGNLISILPRKNELIRPAVANVDQAMVIFAMESPKPNLALLDRFLLMMEWQQVKTIICLNKNDLVSEEETQKLRDTYVLCGYQVLTCSVALGEGMEEIRAVLKGKTTVVAGPSGVGKSSITNQMQNAVLMETGEISRKLKRGKHTTRHSQVIPIDGDSFLIDTPGFSSLDTIAVQKEEIRFYFPEYEKYEGSCRFHGCMHMEEPGCAVKQAVADGAVAATRYENYRFFYQELREKEKRKY